MLSVLTIIYNAADVTEKRLHAILRLSSEEVNFSFFFFDILWSAWQQAFTECFCFSKNCGQDSLKTNMNTFYIYVED